MKILLINDVATASGGAERMTITLRNKLREIGHDARIFSSRARYGPQEIDADFMCYGTTGSIRTANRTLNPFAFVQLRKTLQSFRPDVVHVRMFLSQLSPLILPALRNFPAIYHAPWYETICPSGLKLLPNGSLCEDSVGVACYRNQCVSAVDWPMLMLQLRLFRRWKNVFDAVVTNSSSVKDRLAQHGIGPIQVIYNGVRDRPQRTGLDVVPTIGYIGRLSYEKGVHVLVQAFARVVRAIPEARLLIAGDGPQRQHLEHLILENKLGPHVRMLGFLAQEEIDNAFSDVWAVTSPSLLEEPFASSGAEAMMRGTALIASRGGGFLEMVQHEQTGLLVPPNDPLALADAMARLLNERQLAAAMGAAGRQRALSHFTLEACVESFLSLYQKLI